MIAQLSNYWTTLSGSGGGQDDAFVSGAQTHQISIPTAACLTKSLILNEEHRMNLIICISIVFDEKNMSQKPSKRLGVFHSKSMLPDGQSASRMIARRADRPFVTSSLPEHFHSTGCPTGNQSFEIVFPKILAANYFKLILFTFKIFAEAIFSFGIFRPKAATELTKQSFLLFFS